MHCVRATIYSGLTAGLYNTLFKTQLKTTKFTTKRTIDTQPSPHRNNYVPTLVSGTMTTSLDEQVHRNSSSDRPYRSKPRSSPNDVNM